MAQRVAGMEQAFHDSEVPFIPALICGSPAANESIAEIVDQLFTQAQLNDYQLNNFRPPSAIIASDSVIAMSLLRELGQSRTARATGCIVCDVR